jgi:hypothetical protein
MSAGLLCGVSGGEVLPQAARTVRAKAASLKRCMAAEWRVGGCAATSALPRGQTCFPRNSSPAAKLKSGLRRYAASRWREVAGPRIRSGVTWDVDRAGGITLRSGSSPVRHAASANAGASIGALATGPRRAPRRRFGVAWPEEVASVPPRSSSPRKRGPTCRRGRRRTSRLVIPAQAGTHLPMGGPGAAVALVRAAGDGSPFSRG